jgi:integrase
MRDHCLKTPDRRTAEIAMAELLRMHRIEVMEALNQRAGKSRLVPWPIGVEIPLGGGGKALATKTEVLILDAEDRIIRRKPNVAMGQTFEPDEAEIATAVPKPRLKEDAGILDRWVRDAGINAHLEREARMALGAFQALTNNKPLKDCTRSDGLKLVDHYREEGLKLPTIAKKIGHLRAACNLALKHDALTFNPFSNIMPKKIDVQSIRREDFSEEQMNLVRRNLFTDMFKPDEQLLWLILATTGMRRSEAWQIVEEKLIEDLRCVTIGQKATTSYRTIPLPQELLDHLPKTISGSLFKDADPETGPINVGKRLLRRIRGLGITDERLVIHSLRHRAISRLRYQDCPDQMLFWIVGHNEVTAHDGYGKIPVPRLKPWIDKIGY